jgi:MraZ protein
LLSGTYIYGMDRKGRVVMPAQFRSQLGAPFVLTRAPQQYLLALSVPQWEALVRRHEGSILFRGFYLSSANECPVDETTGRFLVPHVLREYAELRPMEEVAIYGIGRAVHVARRSRWERDLQANSFPALGQLEQDLLVPRPVETQTYHQEVTRMLGIAAVKCRGRLQQRAVRRLISTVEALLQEPTAAILLDFRDAGEVNPAAGLVFSLTRAARAERAMPLWVITEEELPPEEGVTFFRTLEDAFWRLGELRAPEWGSVLAETAPPHGGTIAEARAV